MSGFLEECSVIVNDCQSLLRENTEWIERYAGYASKLMKCRDKRLKLFKKVNEWAPLYFYLPVSNATAGNTWSIRYLGQEVASLNLTSEPYIDTTGFDDNNVKNFGCGIKLNKTPWRSNDAKDFRFFYKNHSQERTNVGKRNDEHRIEELLVTEFKKKKKAIKPIPYIQPIDLFGGRFQMPTPISASNKKAIKYAKSGGGGIDILARQGNGGNVKICIIEVKDENNKDEPPEQAVKQGLAYGVFIRELLRSKSGREWYKLFGFSRSVPEKLEIVVASAMPEKPYDNLDFIGERLTTGDSQDSFIFHSISFTEEDRKLKDLKASWQ